MPRFHFIRIGLPTLAGLMLVGCATTTPVAPDSPPQIAAKTTRPWHAGIDWIRHDPHGIVSLVDGYRFALTARPAPTGE